MRKQLDETTRSLEGALNQNNRLQEDHAVALKKAEKLSERMRGANLDIGLTRELEDAKVPCCFSLAFVLQCFEASVITS